MGFKDRRERMMRVERLGALPLLAGCTRQQLEHVDQLGGDMLVPAGTSLMHEGAGARECFVVVAGAASAHKHGVEVGTVPSGSLAGELALLDHTARTATVEATAPMRLLVLSPAEFDELLTVAPCVEDRVLEVAAERRLALELAAAR